MLTGLFFILTVDYHGILCDTLTMEKQMDIYNIDRGNKTHEVMIESRFFSDGVEFDAFIGKNSVKHLLTQKEEEWIVGWLFDLYI